ncbi:hypothetical protein H072_10564 [Dactylellina haptotyla CBS 200.50]|uniref:Uncharacterized protein n=1 Tax=Dactylellina haptotyla (strain CBS 200.50) TaxID=1284197 RepID=S7ZYY2_DACHA|nr:hypothetical protein H072_10564 [Dactylellina haptotyla CBS 200.50]
MWNVDPFSRLKPEPSPPEAPNPVENQATAPEVVPGGGTHHEQPGLEVVNSEYRPPAFTPESPFPAGKLPPEYEDKSLDRKRRICGLKIWIFFAILAIVVVAAIIGGVVGGVLGSRSSGSRDSSNPPSPSETTIPINIAAVRGGQDGQISTTIIRQDNNTEKFYLHPMVGSQWQDPITIEGLYPVPSKGTSFAALQAPNSTTIRIFYTADNNTLYDAFGSSDNGNWTMGSLGSDTRYGVLISPGSGFAASPWVTGNGNGYSLRVYYIDRTTQSVQELAYDPDGRWVVTGIRFSRALQQGKVALAWVQASNFSYTNNQVMHVFYQDDRSNLLHMPGFDGAWNFTRYSETLGTVAQGTYVAAGVMQDTASSNNTLRLMWLSQGNHLTLLRGKGASPNVVRGFEPRGTFSKPIDVVNLQASRNVAISRIPGGAIAAVSVGAGLRVFYVSAQTPASIVEVAQEQDWSTVGLAT